jgi:hypothetical protein
MDLRLIGEAEPTALQRPRPNPDGCMARIADLERDLAQLRSAVLIYACGCQAPVDLSDQCPVHAAPVRQTTRAPCCED